MRLAISPNKSMHHFPFPQEVSSLCRHHSFWRWESPGNVYLRGKKKIFSKDGRWEDIMEWSYSCTRARFFKARSCDLLGKCYSPLRIWNVTVICKTSWCFLSQGKPLKKWTSNVTFEIVSLAKLYFLDTNNFSSTFVSRSVLCIQNGWQAKRWRETNQVSKGNDACYSVSFCYRLEHIFRRPFHLCCKRSHSPLLFFVPL